MENESVETILDFPFAWSAQTTSSSFGTKSRRRFLTQYGVYGEGMWKRESGLNWIGYPFGELVSDDYVLPCESFILESAPPNVLDLSSLTSLSLKEAPQLDKAPQPDEARLPDQAQLSNVEPLHESNARSLHHNISSHALCRFSGWSEYFEWRGLRLDSPIGVLLQWPLTLHHVITNCLLRDYPDSFSRQIKSDDTEDVLSLTVHVVGAEKEADLVHVFTELGYLLPTIDLDIHLIGPNLSKHVDGKVSRHGRVVVTLHTGLYHMIDGLPTPTLVIGFNAGLAAYTDWLETIRLLQSNRTPAYFTDYSFKSFEFTRQQFKARQQLAASSSSALSQSSTEDWRNVCTSSATVNPFRCPLRLGGASIGQTDSEAMFSNGVLLHLVYSEHAGLDSCNEPVEEMT